MYRCVICRVEAPGWFDQCPGCGRWSTCAELAKTAGRALPWLSDIAPGKDLRLHLREDWDEVLGGGAPPGSVVLVSGMPGAGKTTDLLELAARVGTRRAPSLYLSSERSLAELAAHARAAKIDVSTVKTAQVRELGEALELASSSSWALAALDSWSALDGAEPDDLELVRAAGLPVFFVICHATKEESVAGAERLVHRADALVWVEPELLRAEKNWHGPQGLEVRRTAPSFS